MKVSIEGHHFDTVKASHRWDLCWSDGNNWHEGRVYRSSRGTWYVYTPSQWANRHSWVIMTPAEILAEYDRYLDQAEKEEIAAVAKLEWE